MIYVASSWRNPFYDGVVAILTLRSCPSTTSSIPRPVMLASTGMRWILTGRHGVLKRTARPWLIRVQQRALPWIWTR